MTCDKRDIYDLIIDHSLDLDTPVEGPGMTYPERLGDVWDQPGMELEWKYLKEAQL